MKISLRYIPALLVAILVLLAGLLMTNVWLVYQARVEASRFAARQARVAEIRELTALQDDLIFDLMSNYQDAAYGVGVDRIAEQQLIAAETQIVALQTLALQNRQIAELLLLEYEEPAPVDQGLPQEDATE